MNKIYMLLKNTQEAMKHKVSGDYVSTYITKIPTELHNHLPKIMMLGATMILVFYEVRRGQEGFEHLRLVDFKIVEDNTFDLKYIKKF